MFFHTSFSGPQAQPLAACSLIPVFVPKEKNMGDADLNLNGHDESGDFTELHEVL